MLLMVMSVARVGARGAVADAGDSIAVPTVAPATAEAPSPTSDFKVDSLPLFNRLPPKVKNYLNGFMAGSVDRTREKRVDLSFGISPSYTREASFGIGALCTGLYRVDRTDSVGIPSDLFACLNASLNGFFVFTFKGNNIFPGNRLRLGYKFEAYRKRLDFWGINSEETAVNPKSKYDRRQIDLRTELVYKLTHHLHAGFHTNFDYTDARRMSNPEYLLGGRRQYYVTGLGASLSIDSRNSILQPTRGVHLSYTYMFYPRQLGSAPASFQSHLIIGNAYLGLWRGATLAFDLYAKFNSSHTPWSMREMIASDGIRMRGYYMGSYIDNSQMSLQAELRQHIWWRIGMTAWLGQAAVFSSFRNLSKKEIRPEWLPNGGIGLRFEFKHGVNARIDYGIGRHTAGFVFAVGEAF